MVYKYKDFFVIKRRVFVFLMIVIFELIQQKYKHMRKQTYTQQLTIVQFFETTVSNISLHQKYIVTVRDIALQSDI